MSTFSLVLLNHVMLYPSPGDSRVFSIELINQQNHIEFTLVKPHPVLLTSERASASMVGTIMTLLATLAEAEVLPPEGTVQANQVIHGLIQLQSRIHEIPIP